MMRPITWYAYPHDWRRYLGGGKAKQNTTQTLVLERIGV